MKKILKTKRLHLSHNLILTLLTLVFISGCIPTKQGTYGKNFVGSMFGGGSYWGGKYLHHFKPISLDKKQKVTHQVSAKANINKYYLGYTIRTNLNLNKAKDENHIKAKILLKVEYPNGDKFEETIDFGAKKMWGSRLTTRDEVLLKKTFREKFSPSKHTITISIIEPALNQNLKLYITGQYNHKYENDDYGKIIGISKQ